MCYALTVRNEHRIRVVWEGPLKVDEVVGKSGTEDYGLYQIYGWHQIYGAGRESALLYVGLAVCQTFRARLQQHRADWLNYEVDHRDVEFSIRLGRSPLRSRDLA